MTSFTRKLYNRDPGAADAFHRQATFEHKHTYGRTPTLLCFTMAPREPAGALSPAHHERNVSFGKRAEAPVPPAYECWTPELGDAYPKVVVRAPDSFQARKEYAAHYGTSVVEVAARRLGLDTIHFSKRGS